MRLLKTAIQTAILTMGLTAAPALAGLTFIALSFAAPALIAPAQAAGAHPFMSSVPYSADVTYKSKDMKGSGKIFHAAHNMERREIGMMGQNSIMIIRDSEVLMLMPQMNMAMRMAATQDPVLAAVQKTDDANVRFTKVGSETVNGEKADKYKVEGNAQGLFWVTGDGILVKAEIPADGDVMRYDVTNIKRGAQPKSLFTVPPGTKVIDAGDAGAMMRGMQGLR